MTDSSIINNSIASEVKIALMKIAKETNDLFIQENINIIKKKNIKKIKLTAIQEENLKKLYSYLPYGLWTKTSQLIDFIELNCKKTTIDAVTYSPLSLPYNEFNYCKKMKYLPGNIITGRDNEIDKILTTLCKKGKRGVILIGEAGTGKTSIIQAVNARIIQGTVPRQLIGCQIFNMDIPYILTKYKDDPIGVIIKILERASEYDKAILFIDEVHQLLGHKLNDILKPYLTEQIRFIGCTTINEYHAIITDDVALERRFTTITVDEPNIQQTINMVKGTKKVFEEHHKCNIPDDICDYLVTNGSRFLGHRRNPDKSLDLLDIACTIMYEKEITTIYDTFERTGSVIDVEILKKEINTIRDISTNRTLNMDHINLAISTVTGISYGEIKNSLSYSIVCNEIKKDIIGQDEAINEISNVVNIFKHTKSDRQRPLSILLMVGPKGVGKRKTATSLAKNLFGSENALIEFDLTGMTDQFMITELKGAPPGYVGYSKSGKLIKEIRNNPQSVVYFKNIHKAHQSIQQYLINACQNGKIFDSAEREANLNNTVVIFSSTLSDDEEEKIFNCKTKTMGFSKIDNKDDKSNIENIKNIVGEEVINNVDSVVLFNKLTNEHLSHIFDINVNKQLEIYNVEIDISNLKEVVLEKAKNGKEVINKLISEVPKIVFNKLKEKENV